MGWNVQTLNLSNQVTWFSSWKGKIITKNSFNWFAKAFCRKCDWQDSLSHLRQQFEGILAHFKSKWFSINLETDSIRISRRRYKETQLNYLDSASKWTHHNWRLQADQPQHKIIQDLLTKSQIILTENPGQSSIRSELSFSSLPQRKQQHFHHRW